MTIDFYQNKLIINDTTTSPLIDRGNGWYTVQIPMDKTDINQSANRPDVSPTETFSYLLFHGGYVQRSFLVDNIKIVKEVTPEANNHFTAKNDGVPVVTNWHQSNKCLCFDVYKTDTYQKKNSSQTAKVGLMTINGLALSEPMTIDFNQKKLIINDTLTPSLIDKGNGWYTVQIPMDKTIINQSANRPDVSPTETFGYLYFSSGGVNCSFLVDNFKIESAKGNGDLNGDGKTDKTDVNIFMAYLARNAALPQNAWEADLDHNGVHNARDMSRLKQMLLA